jgi:hypothetical protein
MGLPLLLDGSKKRVIRVFNGYIQDIVVLLNCLNGR